MSLFFLECHCSSEIRNTVPVLSIFIGLYAHMYFFGCFHMFLTCLLVKGFWDKTTTTEYSSESYHSFWFRECDPLTVAVDLPALALCSLLQLRWLWGERNEGVSPDMTSLPAQNWKWYHHWDNSLGFTQNSMVSFEQKNCHDMIMSLLILRRKWCCALVWHWWTSPPPQKKLISCCKEESAC